MTEYFLLPTGRQREAPFSLSHSPVFNGGPWAGPQYQPKRPFGTNTLHSEKYFTHG